MLKLIPPRQGKSPNFTIRGTHLRTRIDRTAGTSSRPLAVRIMRSIEKEIERGEFADPAAPLFVTAARSYLQGGGERRFVASLIDYFGAAALASIDQAAIDKAATTLYPDAMAATRNRQVYTVVSAILKHAGIEKALRRPKGARGNRRLVFLQPADANALLASARSLNPRFGALLTFLLATGCRLSEALRLATDDVDLPRSLAVIGRTKNGEPRTVHLPPAAVTALANIEFAYATVFGFSKAGRIYELLDEAATAAGVKIPPGIAFHIFRHTYGAWMRRYAGLDTSGLVATGAWLSHEAARVYEHVEASEEARKADLLPIGKAVENS
jgi:integrase